MAVARGTAPGPVAAAPPPAAAAGKATVAMSAMDFSASPAPLAQPRPGTGTVPSTAAPATFQGHQQAATAYASPPQGPQTYQGAQQQAPSPGYQTGQPMTPAPYAQHSPSNIPAAPGTMPGAQQMQPAPMMEPRRPSGTQHSAVAPQPMQASPGEVSGGRGPTHVSAQLPPGTPAYSAPPPNIQIVDAPPLNKGLPIWMAGAIGGACLLIGFLIGFLVGR